MTHKLNPIGFKNINDYSFSYEIIQKDDGLEGLTLTDNDEVVLGNASSLENISENLADYSYTIK
jgi:hypothetical protein